MVKKLGSYIGLGILYLFSLLPFWVLFALSDLIYFLIYYVFKYRIKVVRSNIEGSFPNKSKQELIKIEKRFYHHFCDMLVESIKLFTISKSSLKKRLVSENPELLNAYFEKGKSVIAVCGHHNNWEYVGIGMPFLSKLSPQGIYKKLTNPVFDQALLKSRSRYGTNAVEMRDAASMFINLSKPSFMVFISDQSPSNTKNVVWTDFLNRETAVMVGAERFAVKFDIPVVFMELKKVKRGYYTAFFTTLTNEPKLLSPGEITKLHTQALENLIKEKPEYWLWSHKRWKHQKPTT